MGSKPYGQQDNQAKSPTHKNTMKENQGNAALESPKKKATEKIKSSSMDVVDANKVLHFRNLVITESKALTSSCDQWEVFRKENLQNLEEDVEGEIRSVIGQAHLLMAERFTQFDKLVDKYENPDPEDKPVTPTDLTGFWDMIFFQVEDVREKFRKLQTLKERNWIKEEAKNAPGTSKKTTKPKPMKAQPGRNEAARKRLLAAKRAMKERQRLQEDTKEQEAKMDILNQDCHRSQTKNENIITSIAKTIEITL